MNTTETTLDPRRLFDEVRDLRLVQLTDCHLFANAEDDLRGWNTRESFERVFDAIAANEAPFDLLLATGDFSQDETAESYRYLSAKLDSLDVPVAWLPGNHDDQAVMAESFHGDSILPERHLLIGNWHIVLLDSTIPGEVRGRVDERQLEFMHDALRRQSDRHALVCLHHPAIPCGSAWLDRKSLVDDDQFRDAVLAHEHVRGVVWGHVHQEGHSRRDGKEWLATPSTCIQFKPDSVEFALDDAAAGLPQPDSESRRRHRVVGGARRLDSRSASSNLDRPLLILDYYNV